jgi:hypothetical protein
VVDDETGEPLTAPERLAFMREATRFEIGLLHARVNALVAAEAFLTIAFTAAMSNGTPWGATFAAVVSPILSMLGLVLALLAWPGVTATVKIILGWTARQTELLERNPKLMATLWGPSADRLGDRRADSAQWRSMLFFRAAPGLFAVVWAALTVVALVIRR